MGLEKNISSEKEKSNFLPIVEKNENKLIFNSILERGQKELVNMQPIIDIAGVIIPVLDTH